MGGIGIATLLLVIALTLCIGTAKDYLINLSAGVITVVLTVLLVDKLRQSHNMSELYKPNN